MLSYLVVAVICFAAGFATGRVKNANKLASVKAEVTRLASYTAESAKAGLADLKARL